jgi:hypothetical protein
MNPPGSSIDHSIPAPAAGTGARRACPILGGPTGA